MKQNGWVVNQLLPSFHSKKPGMEQLAEQLEKLASYYRSGTTQTYAFRKRQLEQLKHAIIRFEKPLHEALYKDLKKSPEECWITETGIVIAGINHMVRNLEIWMKPKRVR
ncbi:MAG: hypothetical protein H0U44_05920, partial [Flavisolibacter sp.]|nr:hypothetical protein [Flavisolibacter sp.]